MVPNSSVQVVYDHESTEHGGLALRKGDMATLVEMKEQGWCVLRTSSGKRGYFPLSYIAPAAPGAKPLVDAAPAVPVITETDYSQAPMLAQATIQAPQFLAAAELPQPIVMGFPQLPLVHSASSMNESFASRQLPAEQQSGCRVGSQKKREMPTSISFEGCGAAISYHLAVYEGACQVYGRENIKSNKVRMVGTSSGSIAALIAALGLDAEFWRDRLLQIWEPMGKQCFGLLQVDYYVGLALDEILSSVGEKAYEHLCGRLCVSMTHFPMNNVMMSEWKSNGHVKKCILASCFIPVAMLRPVQDGKCFAIDGGFSSNKPRLDGSTCLVSPSRAPGADIMPAVKPRFRDIIGSPDPHRYRAIWDTGLKDALMYFDPDSFSVENRELDMLNESAPKQTQCGRCYFWAMKQLSAMPMCLISWCSLCPPDADTDEGLGKQGGGIGGAGPACCCPPPSNPPSNLEIRSPV